MKRLNGFTLDLTDPGLKRCLSSLLFLFLDWPEKNVKTQSGTDEEKKKVERNHRFISYRTVPVLCPQPTVNIFIQMASPVERINEARSGSKFKLVKYVHTHKHTFWLVVLISSVCFIAVFIGALWKSHYDHLAFGMRLDGARDDGVRSVSRCRALSPLVSSPCIFFCVDNNWCWMRKRRKKKNAPRRLFVCLLDEWRWLAFKRMKHCVVFSFFLSLPPGDSLNGPLLLFLWLSYLVRSPFHDGRWWMIIGGPAMITTFVPGIGASECI